MDDEGITNSDGQFKPDIMSRGNMKTSETEREGRDKERKHTKGQEK